MKARVSQTKSLSSWGRAENPLGVRREADAASALKSLSDGVHAQVCEVRKRVAAVSKEARKNDNMGHP
jgi:hypothetical protein